jgi:hypothetical protein
MIVVVAPKPNTVTIADTSVSALASLTDVDIQSPVDEDVLKYSSGKWVNIPATAGSDANFLHVQSPASAVWTITHNLGKFPNYTVIDSSGDEVEGDVNYVNNQQLIITFSASFSGTAYLN